MSPAVVDPNGVQWSVRRRWYPWRRALSLRDLWSSAPGGKKAEPQDSATSDDAPDTPDAAESTFPRNFLLKALFVVAAAIVWVVYGVGKLLFYTVVVLLFLVGSIIESVIALAVMPITLLLRMIGQSRWPVEIGCQGEYVETRHAPDFAAAGALRSGLLDEIGRGLLPVRRPASSDSTS